MMIFHGASMKPFTAYLPNAGEFTPTRRPNGAGGTLTPQLAAREHRCSSAVRYSEQNAVQDIRHDADR
jgi:hypothetical protein